MIYVVLGMHKSGTTLVAQILHHSGINMIDDATTNMSYELGNQYERNSTRFINQKILNSEGKFSLNIAPPKELKISSEEHNMKSVIQSCNQKYLNWGFKDPRTCLTYPLWASELSEHKIIVIYRSANEMWQRYRDKSVRIKYRFPYASWLLYKRWCEYNALIINYLKNTSKDFIVVEYRKLMTTEAEFYRLQEFVGKPLNDQRQPDLYHHHSKETILTRIASWLVHQQIGYQMRKVTETLESLKEGYGKNKIRF